MNVMAHHLRIALAQLNFLVGDIEGNAQKIIQATKTAQNHYKADLIAFPELALTGYPPEDLLYRHDFYQRIEAIFPAICDSATNIDILLGHPANTVTGCYNRVTFISHQKIISHYDKQRLPNYSVFDEARYFKPGSTTTGVISCKKIKMATIICEDLWFPEPIAQAAKAGVELIISLNASPFAKNKAEIRKQIMKQRIAETHLPILYVNCVGGQDELVFDGGSMAFDRDASLIQQAPFFEESLCIVDIEKSHQGFINIATQDDNHANPPSLTTASSLASKEISQIYKALVLGTRDYIEKNNFPKAILGLSGGIDSALTLAIAVDAIGKERVEAILMPSRYNAETSLIDATQQAETMGVHYEILSIEPIFQAFLNTLYSLLHPSPAYKDISDLKDISITEQNLQARCRGTLLMAISNKKHAIVLSTGNKSEMGVGYSTLYGDMVGGFCVLKDVFKTMVYKLAEYRNSLSPVIPENVLLKAPSAELAFNQKDEDTLPPYPILDGILERYIELDESLSDIVNAGFEEAVVLKVLQMVDRSEYKRRQAAPGIRISERAFGKDRRYPITSGFRPLVAVEDPTHNGDHYSTSFTANST